MKTAQLFTVISVLLLLIPLTILSQTPDIRSNSKDTPVSRKLYLHTDRDQYFIGDTVWYKAYYLDGQSNKIVPGVISMYVDVVGQAGNSVLDQILPIDNGDAGGAIALPYDLEPGNYMLRAFTDFQKQIGEDAFFYKQIQIAKLESFVEVEEQPGSHEAQEIDVAYLPEGGMLLEGMMNTVGIKAIDTRGVGVQIQGEITNSRGEKVVSFNTSYKGMSSVCFVPLKDETYIVSLSGYPNYKYTFTDIVKEGIKIEFDKESTNDLYFNAVTNAESLPGRTFYFAISHHGEVLFQKRFVLKNKSFPITVHKDALPAGINRLVLLDEQLLPVSERLIFSTIYQINEIKIRADKQAYETRSPVRLSLSDSRELDNQSWSNLSMVVVDDFATIKDTPSVTILSWLLLGSELKGHIESPQDYFVDDPEMTSASKLDLLMMTQGWSRYIWRNPEEFLAAETTEEERFNIGGTVTRVVGNKPVTDGTVELKIYNNDFMFMDEVEVDELGKFVFPNISFIDTAAVFLQARNRNDKLSFKISLDPIFKEFPMASIEHFPREGSFVPKQAILYQKQYENLQALKEYTLEKGAFFIDEVTITEHKREPDDGHFRIHATPSNSRTLTEKDVGYMSIFEYIQSHFAGVRVTESNEVFIGGANSFTPTPAMLLLNGIQIDGDVLAHISVSEIDVVEILKFAHEAGIYGTMAGGGVVAVFSKKGGEPDYSDKYLPGTIVLKLEGYSSNREFYSPGYTPETFNTERPDHRIVLYWNPNIFTEKGRASVSFYSSDDISRYKVYVEGITNTGKICLGSAEFEVNKRQ